MQEHDEAMKNNPDAEKAEGQNALSQPKDVFISYASEEKEKAKHIKEILEANGISCWMDDRDIPLGDSYGEEIPGALKECPIVILLLSENSQRSPWVSREILQAINNGKKVIPYKIEDCQLTEKFEFVMQENHYIDGFADETSAMNRVVDSIHTFLRRTDEHSFVYVSKPEMPVKKSEGKGKWIAAAVVVILAILGGLWWYALHRPSGTEDSAATTLGAPAAENAAAQTSAAKVYFSEALPFSKAGFYESYENMSSEIQNEIHSNLAFSILSFVRNFGDQDAVIEKISCEIQELTPIEKPVMGINGYIHDNVLKVFLMNDGWGDAENVEISVETAQLEDKPAFSSIGKAFSEAVQADAAAGKIVYGTEYSLDPAEVKDWAEKNKQESKVSVCGLIMKCRCGEDESVTECTLDYDPETNSFSINQEVPGGIGDGSGSITLFGLLDVDQNPSAITFSGQDAYPVVEDTFRIETVIVATKSCKLNCKGVYSVNGERQETDSYSIDVVVPRFYERSFSDPYSSLMQEIAQADTTDATELAKIAAPYQYDAENYLQILKDNYLK